VTRTNGRMGKIASGRDSWFVFIVIILMIEFMKMGDAHTSEIRSTNMTSCSILFLCRECHVIIIFLCFVTGTEKLQGWTWVWTRHVKVWICIGWVNYIFRSTNKSTVKLSKYNLLLSENITGPKKTEYGIPIYQKFNPEK
jgi:hypothetical protein